MRFPFHALLGIACLALLAGCIADDATAGSEGAIITQQTVAEPGSSTTTPSGEPEAEAAETITTTVPEVLPAPEWAETDFVLQPIAETRRALAMTVRTGGDDLWYGERDGRVRVIQRRLSTDGATEAVKLVDTVVLDISGKVGTEGEGGLLGVDFSPDGQHLYVSYTDTSGNSVVAEYRMDGIAAIEDSERVLLQVEQPFANHNGGQVSVGPDGFLYVALGDGGSGGDPQGNGQDTSTLLGSILRIDPNTTTADTAYGVPDDNPFADGNGGRSEIWLYGVRNPWRFSFDSETGDLWIGDVGQDDIEEIDFLPASDGIGAGRGANLGWNIMEGERPFSGQTPPSDLIGPIAWYGHDNGRCSVIGGYVYRGDRIPELHGVYIFSDLCTGEVFGLKRFGDGRTTQAPLTIGSELGRMVSFGQGTDGELYVLSADGTLSRLQTSGWELATEIYESDEEIPPGVDDDLYTGSAADE